MPGPAPKRDAERRRRNKPDVATTTVDVAGLISEDIEIPAVDEAWHPVARLWYESLARSGQAVFYEPSDWATAYVLAETLDRDLQPKPVVITDADGDQRVEMHTMPLKGSSLTAILKGMTSLMVTEGDRRRLRIELERERGKQELPAGVADITQQRGARVRQAQGGS
jgi:hypothetical protein